VEMVANIGPTRNNSWGGIVPSAPNTTQPESETAAETSETSETKRGDVFE
jgi:hypothetical protein